jgi:hypothetical protein
VGLLTVGLVLTLLGDLASLRAGEGDSLLPWGILLGDSFLLLEAGRTPGLLLGGSLLGLAGALNPALLPVLVLFVLAGLAGALFPIATGILLAGEGSLKPLPLNGLDLPEPPK